MTVLLDAIDTFFSDPKVYPALVSLFITVIGLVIKGYIDRKGLSSKLETEHKFDQQKKIKEALAKYKVQLLTASEELNIRIINFTKHRNESVYKPDDLNPNREYDYQSMIYRILCVYGWIEKLNKEMIFLDTTIATKTDLEFVKCLKLLSTIFCDEKLIVGPTATKKDEQDRILKLRFEALPGCVVFENNIISYSEFEQKLPNIREQLPVLFDFLNGICPEEDRMRWDRLQLVHLTLILFLNNYGYDFHKSTDERIENILKSFRAPERYLKNYFDSFITEYRLNNNKEVRRIKKIAKKYIADNIVSQRGFSFPSIIS